MAGYALVMWRLIDPPSSCAELSSRRPAGKNLGVDMIQFSCGCGDLRALEARYVFAVVYELGMVTDWRLLCRWSGGSVS